MNFKLRFAIFIAVFVLLIAGISSLDSDIETLTKIRSAILVNQVGYLPQWRKTAFILNNQKSQAALELIDTDTRKTVATLKPQQTIKDAATGDLLSAVDFSSITQPGKYYFKRERLKSVPFEIGTDIYQQPLRSLLRSYHLQQCGVEIDDPETGLSHAPCHLGDGLVARQDAYHQADEVLDTTGGWHNGEGYSKYVPTTAVTIARLLNLYEQYPDRFADNQLDLPDADNGVADVLDEMKHGLDWLLKMQRADGAVYRKVAGKTWVLNLPPEADLLPRYVYGISTVSTAKLAAVMAIASRTYQNVDSQLAAKYLAAAQLAWQYLQTQPQGFTDWKQNDNSGSLGFVPAKFNRAASIRVDSGDRLWAAVELYGTTGEAKFNDYITANLSLDHYDGTFSWQNSLSLAFTDYLATTQPQTAATAQKIEAAIQQQAELILARVQQSSYRIANDRFVEGSNKITIEEGITLVNAYRLTQNQAYLDGAIDQLDYILGRNHFDQTFVTGIGTNPVQNPNHITALAQQIKLPGLLVGGPNGDSQDNTAAKGKGQLSYIDDQRAYTTNQNKIDNNASLISLIINLTSAK